MPEPLEVEQHTYEAKKQELLANEGKFVVIKATEVLGVYDTYEDALKAAYSKYGLQSFFVRRIEAIPQISYFTRDLVSCQA
jgi:hypothetical protein